MEDDGDIHLIVSKWYHPRLHMIVELPDVHCKDTARSFKKGRHA